jgi:hypothetical protein
LLRAHAGQGGNVAADLLTDPSLGADQWHVFVLREHVGLIGSGGGRDLWNALFEYAHDPYVCPAGDMLFDYDRPCIVPVTLDSGEQLSVYGFTGFEAVMAQILVRVVANRKVPVARKDNTVERPLTDHLLEGMLAKNYANVPATVAEALMVLSRLPDQRYRRLEMVLCGRKRLRALAGYVEVQMRIGWPLLSRQAFFLDQARQQ